MNINRTKEKKLSIAFVGHTFIPETYGGAEQQTLKLSVSLKNHNIDSFIFGKISNKSNEGGENGKPLLIITLFITPSRSKNIAFLIYLFLIILKKNIVSSFFHYKNTYKNLYFINFKFSLHTK